MSPRVLFVYSPAGPPLDYAMERMARSVGITTCILSPPSAYNRGVIQQHSSAVVDLTPLPLGEALQSIEEMVASGGYDAIFTFAEFLLRAVTRIAVRHGLRSPGANVDSARDKILMRTVWRDAGIPQPRFAAILDRATARETVAALAFPIVIKSANGAGSIGLQVVRDIAQLELHLDRLVAAIDHARRHRKHEIEELSGFPRVIAEEMIVASTWPWYDVPGYGDFVSVEGLVRDGVYYPLAMTGRFPTIEPYTELGNVAPSVMSDDKKAGIVAIVAAAIDALALENCATHTELKLLPDGTISLLETAARMGGVGIARELEVAFGLDFVGLYVGLMLGRSDPIPPFEATSTGRSAASLALIATDSRGRPWPTRHVFAPNQVDWHALAGPDTEVSVLWSQSAADGQRFPPYDAAGGVMNYAGQAFLESRSPAALLDSAYRILNGLREHMPEMAAAETSVGELL